jgi:hypothetical protein
VAPFAFEHEACFSERRLSKAPRESMPSGRDGVKSIARRAKNAGTMRAMPIRAKPLDFDPETLALRVLARIAMAEDLLPRFLALTGLDAAELKARAGEPQLLGSVLDFILFDEALVLRLADELEVKPEAFAKARSRLPGGGQRRGE